MAKRPRGKFQVLSDNLPFGCNPTPTEHELSIEAVDEGRRILCRRQTDCVTFAASKGWNGFVCSACAYSEIMTLGEVRADLDGLANLLFSITA